MKAQSRPAIALLLSLAALFVSAEASADRAATKVAIDRLIVDIAEPDRDVRLAAAWALIEIGPEAKVAVPALVGALNDADPNVRYAAADALEQFSDRANVVVPALIDTLYDSEDIVVYAPPMH